MVTKTVLKTAERDERLGSSTLPSSAKTCRRQGFTKEQDSPGGNPKLETY